MDINSWIQLLLARVVFWGLVVFMWHLSRPALARFARLSYSNCSSVCYTFPGDTVDLWDNGGRFSSWRRKKRCISCTIQQKKKWSVFSVFIVFYTFLQLHLHKVSFSSILPFLLFILLILLSSFWQWMMVAWVYWNIYISMFIQHGFLNGLLCFVYKLLNWDFAINKEHLK